MGFRLVLEYGEAWWGRLWRRYLQDQQPDNCRI